MGGGGGGGGGGGSPAHYQQGYRTVDILSSNPLISPGVPILLRVCKMHNVSTGAGP